MQAGAALVRRVGDAVQRDHLAGVALKSGLGGGTADLIGLGNVGAAGQVPGAALQGRKLDAAGLGVQTAGDRVGQKARRAGQGLVAEGIDCVYIIGQLADIAAVLQLDALGHGDDNGGLLLLHPLDLLHKVVHIEGDLRQADHIHALAVLSLGQCGGGGQPAGVAAHDLNDRHILRAVDRGIADDLLHDNANVLGGAAVAGGVVGDHQVVVDRLGHAHKTDVAADVCAVVGQLADGVHRVVAADVEEVADVQLLQNVKQLNIDGLALGGVPVGQLVAAGAEVAGRGALEQLDVQRSLQLVVQHAGAALQKAGNAVQHAVDLARAAALAAFIDTGQTCVDNGSRAAGLTDDCVFCHGFPPASSACLWFVGCSRPGRGAAKHTNFVILSVPCGGGIYHCGGCLYGRRGRQNDAIPQGGTAVRGKIQQMELRSIVWNFASRIFARIVRQPCKNCEAGAKLCKMTKHGAPAAPPTR